MGKERNAERKPKPKNNKVSASIFKINACIVRDCGEFLDPGYSPSDAVRDPGEGGDGRVPSLTQKSPQFQIFLCVLACLVLVFAQIFITQ